MADFPIVDLTVIVPRGYLDALADRVEQISRAAGWYDTERTFGDDVALLHSEVSEAFEAYRDNGDCLASYGPQTPIAKPEGVPSELADVLIRLVDTAKRYGVNLEAAVEEKLAYNATRGYRHGGKVV